jgi:hypothetical protein
VRPPSCKLKPRTAELSGSRVRVLASFETKPAFRHGAGEPRARPACLLECRTQDRGQAPRSSPQAVEITAQEMLTRDRIALRVTLTAFRRIVDPERIVRS